MALPIGLEDMEDVPPHVQIVAEETEERVLEDVLVLVLVCRLVLNKIFCYKSHGLSLSRA